MSKHEIYLPPGQQDLLDDGLERGLLDKLIDDSRLYKTSKDYKDLLEFVVRLRRFAPFNSMLLQVQKPGLTYAASELDWEVKFSRFPTEGARPLLILWPFGPVALVYDVDDTSGRPLPEDVSAYVATGDIGLHKFNTFQNVLSKKQISMAWVDTGDASAGLIRIVKRANEKGKLSEYKICINKNHSRPVQFVTLAHELGHLFLGHLGPDKTLNVPSRRELTHKIQEIEAESVAYIISERNGIQSKSHTYLSNFVDNESELLDLDVYQVMRAAGQVETVLKLVDRTKFA